MKTHEELVRDLLGKNNVEYQIYEHPRFSSTEEAMGYVPGVTGDNALKSMLFKGDDKFILVVLPVSMRIDKEKVKSIFGIAGKFALATPDETTLHTHCEVGTVSPFIQFYENVSVIFDPVVKNLQNIYITPGVFTKTYSFRSDVLIALIKPRIENIAL